MNKNPVILFLLTCSCLFTSCNFNDPVRKKEKELDKLLEPYDAAIKSVPEDPTTWIKKGDELAKNRKFKEAVECYDKAISLDPENSGYQNNKRKMLATIKEEKN